MHGRLSGELLGLACGPPLCAGCYQPSHYGAERLDENPNKFRLSVQRLGRSHLTVIRTHTCLITSFPVLRRIINDNKLCVKHLFCTLSCGFTLSLATGGQPPSRIDRACVLKAEEVSHFAVIRAVVNDEISTLARFQ